MKTQQPNLMETTEQHVNEKIGIIAGSGNLPKHLLKACVAQGREVFVIAFEGETDEDCVKDVDHEWVHIGSVGKAIKSLKKAGVKEIILAGRVERPTLSSLKLDFGGAKLLTKIVRRRSQGDNAIFSTIISHLEDAGFAVIGIEDGFKELLAPEGVLGEIKPDEDGKKDAITGANVACALGKVDVGQAVIVQRRVVLGVEAVEGTDALMKRCAKLQQEGKGGVLVKMKKPGQDTRIDLPTIGIMTVENAHAAGLRGIAVEAGGALIVDREAVIARADQLGLFLVGIKREATDSQDNFII